MLGTKKMSTKRTLHTKRSVTNITHTVQHRSPDTNKKHPKQTLIPDNGKTSPRQTTIPDNNTAQPKQTILPDKTLSQAVVGDMPNGNTLEATQYRWAAEFMAGPGAYLQKEEIVSDWFSDPIEAKKEALSKAQREVQDYPYSRGRIMKLLVEDNTGTITELSNVKNNVPYR